MRFWAKTAVSEVDLVVSNRGYHVPFEIKLGKKYERGWRRGLDRWRRQQVLHAFVDPQMK